MVPCSTTTTPGSRLRTVAAGKSPDQRRHPISMRQPERPKRTDPGPDPVATTERYRVPDAKVRSGAHSAEYERRRKCAGSTDVNTPIVWFCVRWVAGWTPSSQQIGKDCR